MVPDAEDIQIWITTQTVRAVTCALGETARPGEILASASGFLMMERPQAIAAPINKRKEEKKKKQGRGHGFEVTLASVI